MGVNMGGGLTVTGEDFGSLYPERRRRRLQYHRSHDGDGGDILGFPACCPVEDDSGCHLETCWRKLMSYPRNMSGEEIACSSRELNFAMGASSPFEILQALLFMQRVYDYHIEEFLT